ncbi:MAG: CBS domain-containing protein [Actinomycetota bacterium]
MPATQISDVMQPAPTSVPGSTTVRAAAEVLVLGEIGSVVVRHHGAMSGLVTERDIVRALAEGEDPDELRVEDLMTLDLETVAPDTTVEEAAQVMIDGGIRHLPVVDDGVVVGVVSIRDVLANHRAASV